VNTWIHRIATSDYYNVGPNDIRRWSLGQVADAHRMLDFYDKKQRLKRAKQEKQMENARQ